MSQQRVDDLLVEWELARQQGRELAADELGGADVELVDKLRERIEKLRATSWMLEQDAASDVPSVPQADDTSDGAEVTIAEFFGALAECDVLSDKELEAARQSSRESNNAEELADRLVRSGLLTAYQAAVLLKRKDGSLLLDRYVILDVVGSGGMGVVFKALHRSMERIVALKVLPQHAVNAPDKIARFQREIRAAARLTHPNIVVAYDAHEANGSHFLVMEYVDGVNLWQHVQTHGPLSVEEAVRITAQTADALSEAHRQQIIHRDIKPSNILLCRDGTAKLLDLGLARIRQSESTPPIDEVTRDGLAIGTLSFMSPEQALNARLADAQSDVYSLGCTLYFLLTGRTLFAPATGVQMIVAHREHPIPSLRDSREDIPPELDRLFARMVAKQPDARPQTMDEVRSGLFEAGEPAAPGGRPPAPLPERKAARTGQSRRQAWWWAVGGTSILALAVVLALLVFRSSGPSQREIAEWILDHGGTVQLEAELGLEQAFDVAELPDGRLTVTGVDLTLADTETIQPQLRLPDLESFAADAVTVNGQQVAELARIPDLMLLELSACGIEDEQVGVIATMQQLTLLDLSDNYITDVAMTQLGQLRNLTELRLDNTFITDKGLAQLGDLQQLQYLGLSGTEVTGDGLAVLKALPYLDALDLPEMEISETQIEHLAEISSLRSLWLDGSDIAEGGLKQLSKLSGLELLSLSYSSFEDADIESLRNLPQLFHLDLSGTQITSAGVKQLAPLGQLRELRMAYLEPEETLLQALRELTQLTTLDLEGVDIRDSELALFGEMPLQVLVVGGRHLSNLAIRRFERQHPECMLMLE